MKRNLYYILMMLFILAACVPIPEGLDQAATATQEATATTEPTSTWTPEPTPTLDTYLGIPIETDPSVESENLPVITLADFETGKVLEAEKKYLETHNPFNGNEIWPNSFSIDRINYDWIGKRIGLGKTTNLEQTYYKDPYLLPARNLFIFKINLPKDFFPIPIVLNHKHDDYDYNSLNYVLLGQVWLNPDGQPNNPDERYRVLHYLYILDKEHHPLPGDITKTFLPLPIYYLDIKTINEDREDSYAGTVTVMLPKTLYEKYYKDDIPVNYFDEWLKTNKIPKELENFILPMWGFKF